MNDLDLVTPPPGMPEVRLTLLAVPSTVVLARELVRYALTNWGFDRDVINDSTLVMSEMVTNAVTAARGRRLRLRRALCGGTPLLECWDPSPGLPAQRTPSLMAENGRGLAIIHAYAKETGTRPSATGEGKTVWGKCPPERPGPNTSRRSCIWGRPSPRFRGWSAASRTAGAHGLGFGRGWSGGTHFPGGMWAVGWGKPERAGGQCRKISTIPPPPTPVRPCRAAPEMSCRHAISRAVCISITVAGRRIPRRGSCPGASGSSSTGEPIFGAWTPLSPGRRPTRPTASSRT